MKIKKIVLFFYLLIPLVFLSAQSTQEPIPPFQITSVVYFTTGETREYSLKKNVKIDTNRVFNSEHSLRTYIADLHTQLRNLRQIESVEINTIFEELKNGIMPVSLEIYTRDTWNLIILPFPKFDSNRGFELNIKVNHYNFLGSLQSLTSEASYRYDEDGYHRIGGRLSYDFPFKLGVFDATWRNSLDLAYIFNNTFDAAVSSGLDFSLPIGEHKLEFGFTQSFRNDPGNEEQTTPYFTEAIFLRMPIELIKTESNGNIKWTPSVSFTQNWGTDSFTRGWDGITDPDLKGPEILFSHSLSAGRADWEHNFRNGFTFSASQGLVYNFGKSGVYPVENVQLAAYKGFKYVGITGRFNWFRNGAKQQIGPFMRGVRDIDTYLTESALTLNIDLPIKIFESKWIEWGFPAFFRYLECEIQLSPFVDITLWQNPYANNRMYSFKDGFYTAGIEMLIYPAKIRSIVARISFGADISRLLPDTITNKQWRPNTPWFELYFGTGWFY